MRDDDVRMQAERPSSSPIDLLVAVAIPLALLAVAYASWAISDRLLWIGPFDRAAFGWTFVMPIAWLAPGIAGLGWSRMPSARRRIAALIVGAAVAGVSGVLLAHSITFANCAPVVSWIDNLPASLVIGAVIGAGPAGGALAAASVGQRLTGLGRIVAAIATGAVIGFLGLLAFFVAWALFFPSLSCAPIPQ